MIKEEFLQVLHYKDLLVNLSRKNMAVIKEEFLQVLHYKDLLINLVYRDLTARYKRSAVGFLWTMIYPLVNTVVFTIVFSTIFRFSAKDFVIYFLSGYQVWLLFSQITILSSRCILANGQLLKRVYLPKAIFVTSILFSELVNFAFAMLPLFILLLLLGKSINFELLFLPVSMVIILLFTLGISFLLAAVSVFFVDIIEIYQLLLLPWMFATPIFYPLEILPSKAIFFIKLNPMYSIIECFRSPIYTGHLPDLITIVYAFIFAVVTFIIGLYYFNKFSDNFFYYI